MTSGPCDQLFWPRAIYTNIVHIYICCMLLLFFSTFSQLMLRAYKALCMPHRRLRIRFLSRHWKATMYGNPSLHFYFFYYHHYNSTTLYGNPPLWPNIPSGGRSSVGVVDRLQNGKSKEKVEGAKFSFYKIGIQMGTAQIVIWAIKARFAYQYIMPVTRVTHDHLHSIIRSKQNRTKNKRQDCVVLLKHLLIAHPQVLF